MTSKRIARPELEGDKQTLAKAYRQGSRESQEDAVVHNRDVS